MEIPKADKRGLYILNRTVGTLLVNVTFEPGPDGAEVASHPVIWGLTRNRKPKMACPRSQTEARPVWWERWWERNEQLSQKTRPEKQGVE